MALVTRAQQNNKRFYNYQQVQGSHTIRVSDIRTPRSLPLVFIPRAWARGLGDRMKIDAIEDSGNIYLKDGVFSPLPIEGGSKNLKGQILGLVVQDGDTRVIPMGKYKYLDQVSHVENTIEIVPSQNPKKLKVVEARMETNGLRNDQSKFIYNISAEGEKRIKAFIADINWITDVRINGNKEVDITYRLPDGSVHHLVMNERYFSDNNQKGLLGGRRTSNMGGPNDFYQSESYTPETERFKPVIDRFPARNGNLRLILHKSETYEIKRPAGLEGDNFKIFPAIAVGAAKVGDRWLPLARTEPLPHLESRTRIQKAFYTAEIDLNTSRVQAGENQSAIGPQTRFGNLTEMSGQYVRDAYFYGLKIFAKLGNLLRWGANIAINRGKSVRAGSGIESGRTHTMPWHLILDKLRGDLIETNSEFAVKLSNYGHQESGPGVSEDTQMELITRALGVKMHVVSEMVARMAAEKWWGKFNIQNAIRYIFSESLFARPFRFALADIASGRFLGRQPIYQKWNSISEVAAGRTWYKWILSKLTELAAVPLFLLTAGHVLFFPVDLQYFIFAWCARTVISSISYALHMVSLGYKGIRTGFWENPAYEQTFTPGYLRSALRQFLDRNQWATFALTVGGASGAPPAKNKWWIGAQIAFQGLSLGVGTTLIVLGGLTQLVWPLGLAILVNMFFGGYSMAVNIKALLLMRRETKAVAPHGKHKKIDDFQNERPEDYDIFKHVVDRMHENQGNLSYDALFAYRKSLVDTLKKLGAMNKEGDILAAWGNEYRDVANLIGDVFTSIEMMICMKALGEIKETNSSAAKTALAKLMQETKEFVIMDTAVKAVRLHGLEI